MSNFKINAAALTAAAREQAAALLDEHAEDIDDLLGGADLKPGERLAARTSATQARLLALELRGADAGDADKLRDEVRSLGRKLEVAQAELARLKGLAQ